MADAVREDVCKAPLGAADRVLVAYAQDLTHRPAGRAAERVAELRAAGFADAAILRVTEIVAYFNYVNRVAEGLAVELESGHP